MDMIKDTPDELGIPSFDIVAANVMCEIASNPGISHREMFKLALVITRDHFDKPVSVRSRLLENEAKRFLSKKETERIEATTQEATHKIINGAHLFEGYGSPDPDDQYRGPNGAA